MPSSRNNQRIELPRELWAALVVEAGEASATAQQMARAILRASLVEIRRRRKGGGDEVAYFLAEGDACERAAAEHLQLWGFPAAEGWATPRGEGDRAENVVAASGG